jgi:hypothetical protein
MLHQFLTVHRQEIIDLTRRKVALRRAPRATESELENGVPLFLEQLTEILRSETEGAGGTRTEMARSAARHGGELRQAGFTVGQVVHDYGDVCQAVTELAIELRTPIAAEEFKILNRCLDEAIAQAVTEFARQREVSLSDRETERLGFFAHELRNLLSNAMLSFEVLKTGAVGIGGSTGGNGARRSSSPASWKRSRWRRPSKRTAAASSSPSPPWRRGQPSTWTGS